MGRASEYQYERGSVMTTENESYYKVFSVKLPPALLESLRERAARESRSVGSVIRQAINESQLRDPGWSAPYPVCGERRVSDIEERPASLAA
jgi:hypothetical protein